MVNSKDFAFKVSKQAPTNGSVPPAYGTVIDCRPPGGKRGTKGSKEVKSRQVRLTRVLGPSDVEFKKRKRDSKDYEDDLSTADKEPDVVAASSGPAPIRPSTERLLIVRKPQLPTPTKFRRGTILKKEVDLDSWFTVLRFSDPAQLLEMHGKIAPFYRFLTNNPMLWKHSRDFFYDKTLPDPPSELTEFQYAHLRHGHGCMSCHTPSTRKTYWAFLRRWCKTCLHSKTIKEPEVITLLKDVSDEHYMDLLKCLPVAIFDSWENYVGVGPANTHPQKNVYIQRDVQNMIAEYVKERNANAATWQVESKKWMDKKQKVIQERHGFARKMEHWDDQARQSKSSDFHEKKAARKKYFIEKAAELTPPIPEKDLAACPSYRRAILIPKMPNMLSWSQLKPKVEKEAADFRAQSASAPPDPRPDQRHLPDPTTLGSSGHVGHHLPFYSQSRTTTPSTGPFY